MSISYKQAHEYLDTLLVFGIKLGLKNMEVLCDLLGSPQDSLKFIHVAGTNGKGSSCSMLAASLKSAGVKTGFYSSPFLYRFTERWRINGVEVTEQDVANALGQIMAVEEKLIEETGVKPTYFEVLTAAALLIFKDNDVDVVIWETGMGGRLDATNVVKPLVSLITNIGLDHTQYLGETIEEVAGEKAGIIKSEVPVVLGEVCTNSFAVFLQKAQELNSDVFQLGKDFSVSDLGLENVGASPVRNVSYASNSFDHKFALKMLGLFQVKNLGPVVKSLELISEKLSLDITLLVKGLEQSIWPGRFEVRDDLVIDGAHNAHAARVLVDSLKDLYPNDKFSFVCGILEDKDWQSVLDIFAEVADDFWMAEVKNVRTSKPENLSDYAESIGSLVRGQGSVEEGIESRDKAKKNIVVGSLYLIGEVLEFLNDGEALKIDSL
ncbi:MAG: bifunctional folylpolyglutamate synthase/dihydrofolate synthase [Lentisphaeraceae bacterium]|nr:bifunctional folylpolyglutamate synthase/dihydrofolate synthase [Lentisphaeraceae bacterium]